MLKLHSDIYALCPWCKRGKTMANKNADIQISCHCPICGQFYRVDFKTMRVDRIRPDSIRKHRMF